jgi:nitroreductase
MDAWWLDPDGAPGPMLRACVAAAVAAPSVHNTQPWLFRPRQDGVEVFVDRRRQARVIDPSGREQLMSVGAAVLNLRVAVLAHGRVPVLKLLPHGASVDLVARLSSGPPVASSSTARVLARAIPQRRTNRWPFRRTPIPVRTVNDLVKAVAAEGAVLRVLGDTARLTVLGLTRTAEHHWQDDPAYRRELARWTSRRRQGDGIPHEAIGPPPNLDVLPLRDLGLGRPVATGHAAEFEPATTVAVLYTERDAPEDWLRAGQALQRALLTATVRGLAATPMTQALEIPRLRSLVSDPVVGLTAQAVVRFGFPLAPAPATPRRPLADVLDGPAAAGANRPQWTDEPFAPPSSAHLVGPGR